MSQSGTDIADITDRGERVTHLYPNDCYYAHLSLYGFGLPFVRGRRVLDAGSGSGYGTAYLASHGAASATGWEVSPKAVTFSRRHFRLPNLTYECVDLSNILGAGKGPGFEVLFSSNVLEHLSDVPAFLSKAMGLLTPDAVAVIAVPPIVSEAHREDNLHNAYHLNIWSPWQWRYVLGHYFGRVDAYTHAPASPEMPLDFGNTPDRSHLTEHDFRFEPANLDQPGYEYPTITALFVARGPRGTGSSPGAGPEPFFIDRSFSREPESTHWEVGPGGVQSDVAATDGTTLGPVAAGNRYCQRFVARYDGLTAISLVFGTYCRVIRSTFRLTILDDLLQPVREVSLNTTDLVDNNWRTFVFDPLPGSRGRSYRFCVETDGNDEAVTLYTNNTSGVLDRNGIPCDGCICFRSYYQHYPLGR